MNKKCSDSNKIPQIEYSSGRYDIDSDYFQKWQESLRYISLLDKSEVMQIHDNIENDVYDDPIIFDIIIQALIEQYFS